MKKTILFAVLGVMIAGSTMTGCKKGEGDPFLSLKSRKSRLAGEWTVSSGSGTDVSGGQTTTWTYDGTVETTTYPSPIPQSTDKYTLTYTIEKDGTWSSIHTDNNTSTPQTTTTTGIWNFTGKIGEAKNKSQVVFHILSITNSSGSVSYTGSDAPSSIMDLYQLKSKEVIVKYKGTTSTPSSTSEGEWTWTAK